MDVSVHPLRSTVAIACRPKKESEEGDSAMFSKTRKAKKSDNKKKKQVKQLGYTDGRLEFWDYNLKQLETIADTYNFSPTCLV